MSQATAPVTITLLRGAGVPFTENKKMLVHISNDRDIDTSFWADAPTVQADLQFHEGPGDSYRLVVSVDGYGNSGGFVHADPGKHPTLEMLMIPKNASFDFPGWAQLKAKLPQTAALIAAGTGDENAKTRYEALGTDKPLALASLMNLCAAMQQIGLGGGRTVMDFLKEVIWNQTLAQDRFFGYAESGIIEAVKAAAADGEFAREPHPERFHPNATLSYKQTQYDYSNVQLTFHEHDTKMIGSTQWVKIEPDMDLYQNLLNHGLLEVLPNALTRGHTNPLAVLALRWIDAVQNEEPLFDPGYLLS